MDGQLGSVVSLDDDDLEQIARSVESEVEHTQRWGVFQIACVQRMVDGMPDVLVGNPMLPR